MLGVLQNPHSAQSMCKLLQQRNASINAGFQYHVVPMRDAQMFLGIAEQHARTNP